MISTWARGVWRRQLGALLVLGVIAGLGVGGGLVALEGARRADSAYDRLAEETLGPDLLTTVDDPLFDQLAARPDVEAAARFSYTPVAPEPLVPGVDAGAFAAIDEDFLTEVYRPAIIDGRALAPGATDEVLINEAAADVSGYGPGDRVTLQSGFADGEVVSLGEATVAGIARGQFDVGANAGNPALLLPHAFVEAHRDELILQEDPPPSAMLRLRPGADRAGLEQQAKEIAGQEVGFLSADEEADAVNRSLHVQSVGYTALALVLLAATLLVVVQGIARQVRAALDDELRTLVAIGMAPRVRHLLALTLALPVIATGAVVAVLVGVLGSPLVPTGLARDVDLDTGVQIDLTVLVAGAVGVIVVLGVLAAAVAWRVRGAMPLRPAGPSRTSRALAQLPLRSRLGAELALAPRRAPAGPAARSALAATAFATAAVLGVAVFATSLDRLLDPDHVELAGWSFDVAVLPYEGADPAAFEEGLQAAIAASPPDAMSRAYVVNLLVGGAPLEAFAFEPSDHPVHPTMREGRAPVADDEIALGLDTAGQLGATLGDEVDVSGPEGSRSLRLVGIATYPELGNNGDIGNSGSVTADLASDLGAIESDSGVLLRYEGGADAATVEALSTVGETVEPFLGPRVRRLDQVGGIPRVLAILLALLGAAAVGHGLVRATMDRRRDLAVLRGFGLRPRDVRLIVASQGAVIGLVGGALGLVAGLIVGPWVWERVADGVAAVPSVAVPAGLFIAAVPATVGLALITSVWPGWRASRRSVVDGLMAEDARA